MEWGGYYGSGGGLVSGEVKLSDDEQTKLWGLSWTLDRSPASNYSGPKFYGAFEAWRADGNPDLNYFGVGSTGSGDAAYSRFTIGQQNSAGATQALVFFQKDDFLNGAGQQDQKVVFEEGSSIWILFSPFVGDSGGRQGRAAVYASIDGEWSWYLSSSRVTSAANLRIDDPANQLWAKYGLQEEEFFPEIPGTDAYTVAGSLFEDIQAVGFFMQNITEGSGAYALIRNIEFNASVIPESQYVSLFIVLGIVAFSRLRKKRV